MKTNLIAFLSMVGAFAAADAAAQVRKLTPSSTRVAATAKVTASPVSPTSLPDFWLHVLHNNDGECKVLPLSGSQAGFGGAARFKTLVDTLKAQADTPRGDGVDQGWVMISSGDNILPGVNFNASLDRGVPFYDSVLLDLIGYSAVTLGNHDFDLGPDVLADLIRGTATTTFISANLSFAAEPALAAEQAAGRLAPVKIVTVDGRQIGIIGGTTESLPFISSPRNTTIGPVLAAVQAQVDALTASGVKIIILSTHLQGLPSELALVAQVRGVDAVIAGGGSELLAKPTDLLVPGDSATHPYPVVVSDLDGRQVPVVTTVGDYKYVGRLALGFDADGNLVATDDALSGARRVSGVAPDAVNADSVVQTLIVDPIQAANDALSANVLAQSDVRLDSRRNATGTPAPQTNVGIRVSETNAGNLVADALLWEASRIAATSGLPQPDVSIQNGGGIRINARQSAGPITERYTYDQLPFANFLTLVPAVPADRLKIILENAFSRVASADGRFPHVSGMRIVWDASQTAQVLTPDVPPFTVSTPGSRVREVVLADGRVLIANGQVVPGAPAVNIATIDFLAVQGGDQYPFNNAPFVRLGVTYQRALRNYIVEFLGGRITALDYAERINDRIIRRN
jgi:5'-nucleotidase